MKRTEVQKAIIKSDDKFLIVLRSPKAKYFPEHWDFPGGKLDLNEDPFAGIEREVLEETGLKVKALDVVGVYELDLENKDGEKILHRFMVYSAKIISGDVKLSDEHLEFQWAAKEEILGLKIEPYMRLYFEEHM
jgi:8-oxo-dGTP pyrophosphatase MutT (NUDIX family)